MNGKNPREYPVQMAPSPGAMRSIGAAVIVFVLILIGATSSYIVPPGHRGIEVTLGKVSPQFKAEGFGLKKPFVTHIHPMTVRQQTRAMPAECYSSDLQQVKMELHVLYRIPETSVVRIFQDFAGEPFDSLIAPRVQEALKEVAATHSAEMIVKKREEVKTRALDLARRKISTNFGTNSPEVVDIVLYHLSLSPELEAAIEAKMVQEQEAEKAKFTQLKAQIEADTAIIRAKGEAEAIQVRGQALRDSPDFIRLQVVQTWNGKSPLVVGADGGANLLLQMSELEKSAATPATRPARPTVPPRPR